MRARWMSLTIVFASAGLWSIALGVLGAWLIAEPHTGILSHDSVSISAGLGCLCAAQLVFLECVADRAFPRTHRGIRIGIKGANALTLGGSVCVLLLAVVIVRI